MDKNKKVDNDIKDKVENVLDRLRPYILDDGGDIEFVNYENGICYLKFLGHCATCPMKMMTLNELFKESLVNEIDEITEVRLESEEN